MTPDEAISHVADLLRARGDNATASKVLELRFEDDATEDELDADRRMYDHLAEPGRNETEEHDHG